jgi:hypothetical protein
MQPVPCGLIAVVHEPTAVEGAVGGTGNSVTLIGSGFGGSNFSKSFSDGSSAEADIAKLKQDKTLSDVASSRRRARMDIRLDLIMILAPLRFMGVIGFHGTSERAPQATLIRSA